MFNQHYWGDMNRGEVQDLHSFVLSRHSPDFLFERSTRKIIPLKRSTSQTITFERSTSMIIALRHSAN
jgi:hypothetical protein